MSGQVLEIAPSDPWGRSKCCARPGSGHVAIEEVEMYGSLVHVVAPDMKKHQGAIKSFE